MKLQILAAKPGSVDTESLHSFLLLGYLFIYLYKKQKLPDSILKHTFELGKKGYRFVKQFNLAPKSYSSMVRRMSKGYAYERVEPRAFDVAYAIADSKAELKANLSISRDDYNSLLALRSYILRDSETAFNTLMKRLGTLGDQSVSALFAMKVVKPTNVKKEVEDLVKKLTGKAGYDLTIPERQKFAKSKPSLYKEFLKARSHLLKIGKLKLASIVRSSGSPLLDIKKAKEELEKEGYVHVIPDGFYPGYVDEYGNFYTAAKRMLKGKPAGNAQVQMNPKYDPSKDNAYVLRARVPLMVTKNGK